MKTIYTIGYQQLTIDKLRHICAATGVQKLIDTRSVPRSRKAGFSGRQIALSLPEIYEWHGDKLGGKPGDMKQTGIELLQSYIDEQKTVLLLCLEEAPGDCHRHQQIAKRLLPHIDVLHIYRDEVVAASELERALRENEEYEYRDLSSFFESLTASCQ